jgi:His-Xaa-Ser system radical SAM maturase HxsB
VKEAVIHAEHVNKKARKKLEFVLCTNLTHIDEEILAFVKDHKILISTSLDGPKDLHDRNRIVRKGGSSYDLFLDKLELTRRYLGDDQVSALMTTSKESIGRMREVVDEYVKQGFRGIFLRALNPYGFAKRDREMLGYKIEDFIESYKTTLEYIIDLNLNGTYFEEYYTTLLLSRILTPFSTGFMDLQSPSGAGLYGVMYDFNGDVYPSDEARMLAKTGDKEFLMGNVKKDAYIDVFGGNTLLNMVNKSCVETLPGCSWCAFQPYCGSDPVRNYSEQGDIIGHRPTCDFCKKHMGIMKHLFELIHINEDDIMDVFWSWITRRPLEEILGAES